MKVKVSYESRVFNSNRVMVIATVEVMDKGKLDTDRIFLGNADRGPVISNLVSIGSPGSDSATASTSKSFPIEELPAAQNWADEMIETIRTQYRNFLGNLSCDIPEDKVYDIADMPEHGYIIGCPCSRCRW